MKRFICCLLSLFLCAAVTQAAYAPGSSRPAASPDGQRYLFIIDTSSRMDDLQSANEASLYDLLRSGVGGHMQSGDTYGIWTFNDEVKTSFPMQVWDFKRAVQLGTIAAAYINQERYEHSSKLKAAMTDLFTVARSISNLTVFIISDGHADMKGTPFDKTINEEYRKQNRNRKNAKRPFVTTLIVRDGWFVQSQVTVSGQPIILPPRPDPGWVSREKSHPPVSATNVPPKAVAKAEPPASSTAHPAPDVPPAASKTAVVASTPSETGSRAVPNNLAGSPDPTTTMNANGESPKPRKVIQIVTKPPSVAIPVVDTNATLPNAGTASLPTTEAAGSNGIAGIVTPLAPTSSPPATLAKAPASSEAPGSGGSAREPVVPTPHPKMVSSSAVETVPASAPASTEQPPSTSPWNGLKNVLSPAPLPVAARELAPADGGSANGGGTESPASLPVQPVMAMPVAPSREIHLALVGLGAASLLLGLGLVVVLVRRPRAASPGSIITQSMERR